MYILCIDILYFIEVKANFQKRYVHTESAPEIRDLRVLDRFRTCVTYGALNFPAFSRKSSDKISNHDF